MSILLALALMFTVATVNVSATDGVVIKEFKGSDGGFNGPENAYTKNEDAGTATIETGYGGHAYGYGIGGDDLVPYAGKVVKIAFYLTFEDVENTSARMRVSPFVKRPDDKGGWAERWVDASYGELADYEGEKVIAVGAYTVADNDAFAAENMIESVKNTTPDDDNKDDGKTTAPATADVSMMLAVMATGTAIFDGVKLKKK